MSELFSPLTLAAHASALMPELSIVGLCEPQSSDAAIQRQGVVDAQGRTWVVCAPLTDAAGAGVEAQTTLLAILHRAYQLRVLPFDVPVAVARGRRRGSAGIFVHEHIPGTTLTWEELSSSSLLPAAVGRAIAALHRLPEEVIKRSGLPWYDAEQCRQRLRSVLEEGRKRWTIPANLYERWEQTLDEDSLFRFTPRVIHGDMDVDSFLVNSGIITSISAFASAEVGDPAADIAWIASGEDERVAEEFFRAYSASMGEGTDLHILTRSRLYSELALVRWLLHGYRTEDLEVIRDAQQMIEEVAEDVGDSTLVSSMPTPPPQSRVARVETAGPGAAVAASGVLSEDLNWDPDAPTVNLSAVIDEIASAYLPPEDVEVDRE